MMRSRTPAHPQRRLRRTSLRVLSDALGDRAAREVTAMALATFPEVADRAHATRAGARDLLRAGSYVIALDRALTAQGVEPAQARSLIADAVNDWIMPIRTALYRIAGLRFHTPLDRARWGASVTRRIYYTPPDWIMKDVEVPDGFGFDVIRCVVAEFFESQGLGDLCNETVCVQDIRSAARHGVVLQRTSTIARGDGRCDFRYHSTCPRVHDSDPRAGGRRHRGTRAALADHVRIDAPPARVWSWLESMADHYAAWHPDHVSAVWTRGPPNTVGSRLVVVEVLGGHRESLTFEVTGVDPPHCLEYRVLGPHGWLLPGGRFTIAGTEGGAVFTAEIDIRLPAPMRRLFRRRVRTLRTHMREEGASLKRLIEEDKTPADSTDPASVGS